MSTEPDNASFITVLAELRHLLSSLPPESKLPWVDKGKHSHYAIFLDFALDPELMEKIEDEVGVFSEQFKSVFGWQTRSQGEGLVPIEERGPAICAVVDVLREFHKRYPDNEVIMKWGRDVLKGVRSVYMKNGLDIPSVVRIPELQMTCFHSMTGQMSTDLKPKPSKRKRSASVDVVDSDVEVASSKRDSLGRTADSPKMVSVTLCFYTSPDS